MSMAQEFKKKTNFIDSERPHEPLNFGGLPKDGQVPTARNLALLLLVAAVHEDHGPCHLSRLPALLKIAEGHAVVKYLFAFNRMPTADCLYLGSSKFPI
jgi:hypothetical protein